MSNFIPMVYAVLKDKGVDTKGMSTDEAVKKYNELNGKDGGFDAKSGEKKLVDYVDKKQKENKEKAKADPKREEMIQTYALLSGFSPATAKYDIEEMENNSIFDEDTQEYLEWLKNPQKILEEYKFKAGDKDDEKLKEHLLSLVGKKK